MSDRRSYLLDSDGNGKLGWTSDERVYSASDAACNADKFSARRTLILKKDCDWKTVLNQRGIDYLGIVISFAKGMMNGGVRVHPSKSLSSYFLTEDHGVWFLHASDDGIRYSPLMFLVENYSEISYEEKEEKYAKAPEPLTLAVCRDGNVYDLIAEPKKWILL